MASKKIKAYPYLYLSLDGKIQNVSVQGYPSEANLSIQYSSITLPLPLLEIELDLPEQDDINRRCVELLRADRDKLRAEHTALMTKYQFLENQLLGLPAPDIVEGDGRRRYEDQPIEDAAVKPEKNWGKGEGDDPDFPF